MFLLRIQPCVFKMLKLLGPRVNKFILTAILFFSERKKKRKKQLAAVNGAAAVEGWSLKRSSAAVNPEQVTPHQDRTCRAKIFPMLKSVYYRNK